MGWNLSNRNLLEIFDFINNMPIETEKAKRDKLILEYAFIDNLSALQISKLDDDRLIGYGNRNNGERLTNNQISRIIKSYNLIHEKKKDYTKSKNYARYKKLRIRIQNNEIQKPKICGICGTKECLEMHHLIPVKYGGNDDFQNLLYLCRDCHKLLHHEIRKLESKGTFNYENTK